MSKTPWIVAVQNRSDIVSECVRCGSVLKIGLAVAVNSLCRGSQGVHSGAQEL